MGSLFKVNLVVATYILLFLFLMFPFGTILQTILFCYEVRKNEMEILWNKRFTCFEDKKI